MARLFKNEAKDKTQQLKNILHVNAFLGVTESEAADTLGWERRTVNNYLRELQITGKAEKKGRAWFEKF